MPYPLLKLPYGLQQRLRSLSTPKEAYFLQVAAGFETNYFQPFQMYTNISTITEEPLRVHRMDGNIVVTTIMYWLFNNRKVFDWKNGSLTNVQSYLELISLKTEDYDSPAFNALLIECWNLKLVQSVLNCTTFCKLVKQLDPLKITQFKVIFDVSRDLTIRTICDTFVNLQHLHLQSADYASKDWMRDLLNFRKLNLKKLTIGGEFENLFSFELHEVSQLFEKEGPEFCLTLIFWHWHSPLNDVYLIRQMFGPHFKEFKKINHDAYKDGFLNIRLGNRYVGEDDVEMYFQVGAFTDRIKQSYYEAV